MGVYTVITNAPWLYNFSRGEGQVPPLAHGSMLQCSANSVNARLIIRMIQHILGLPARYPGAHNERMDLRGDWIELHHIWTGHTVDRSSAPPKSFFSILDIC